MILVKRDSISNMVVQTLENSKNLGKSGNKIYDREKLEKLEKSENFTERAQTKFFSLFVVRNNTFFR